MSKIKIGICGYGWVGKSMKQLFPNALVYDPYYRISDGESFIKTKEDLNTCDIGFICVPTPHLKNGSLDVSIIEDVLSWLKCPLVIIRSTINPGDCDIWINKYERRIVFQPEYLGETPNHPMSNPKNREFMIIGGLPEDRRELIELYTSVYNANITIRQVTAYEAEVIKLSENRAIAFKVAECQELYDACEKAEIDYYTVRDAVYGDDPRFNLWWSFIYPNKRGMNSKCIPKDVYAWATWAESMDYKPEITKAILKKNEEWIK